MTTLTAVNRILASIGQPPVTALDTGGTSDQAEAETYLDTARNETLSEGWLCNTIPEILVNIPDVSITYSGAAPAFTFGETITESVSGATGLFNYTSGTDGAVFVSAMTGSFTGGHLLTGGTSNVTKTGVTKAALTTSKVGLNTNWLRVGPSNNETRQIIRRGNFAYNASLNTSSSNPPANIDPPTYYFDSDIRVYVAELQDFTDLQIAMQAYITEMAAMNFQRYRKHGQIDEILCQRRLQEAKNRARNEDNEFRGNYLMHTPDATAFLGNRVTYPLTRDPRYM